MNYLLFFLLASLISCTNQAQGNDPNVNSASVAAMINTDSESDTIWVDYVMGKPYMKHYEAMAATAKKWGINYYAKFMGCVVDDDMVAEEKVQEKSNQKYFAELDTKFGKDWRKRFDLDVKKHLPIYTEIENPVWKDPVLGKPDTKYFEMKEAVAKEWGINFQPLYLGCVADKPGVKAEEKAANKKSDEYRNAIAKHFGKDWETYFNAEVEARLEEMRAKN